MSRHCLDLWRSAAVLFIFLIWHASDAAVTAEEATKLRTTLTPMGAERAGNAEGTIPLWTGGFNQPYAGYTPGGRRPDPFAKDLPIFSIDAKSMEHYADKLTEGTKTLLKKYPDYRLDVYKTLRTARMPDFVQERTMKNAVMTRLAPSASSGQALAQFNGGIPFPIPRSAEEVMWNHMLHFRGENDGRVDMRDYLRTADGKLVLISDVETKVRSPQNRRDFKPDEWDLVYDKLLSITKAPALRSGEQILSLTSLDVDRSAAYVYLPGQRRTRRIPNPCCDSPSILVAGVGSVDETSIWFGRLDRFTWKLMGKKELYIPYNTNRYMVPPDDKKLIGDKFLNPDLIRWELHRVWVVEAQLAPSARHEVSKSVYYIDEDTWIAVLADRWDSHGQLWKHLFTLPWVAADDQFVAAITFGAYDFISGTAVVAGVFNEKQQQAQFVPSYPASVFSPDSIAATSAR